MDAGPEIEGRHHHGHTGRPLLDLVLGVSAIVISVISLALAILHGNAMERLVEANSWPFVETNTSSAETDGSLHFRLGMVNKGVGPARIESLTVFYDGEPAEGPRALVDSIAGGPGKPRINLLTSDVLNNVLSAKEAVNFVDVPVAGATAEQQGRLVEASHKMTFLTCYCSVFDECWTIDTREAAPHAHRTRICPAPVGNF